mmetsp:Transcript_85758/g.246163  ORF Transcript_85758/g.246163 Transcript_85758/m.246163 type:complete len:237 (-) Transcript_85758:157-867(-)
MGKLMSLEVVGLSAQPRLLCLSGHASKRDVTECQAMVLELERHGMELDYLDGPFETPTALDPTIQDQIPGPFYVWSDAPRGRHSRETLRAGVEHVLRYVASHGPFDGIYGFSNGGLIAALATEAMEQALAAGGGSAASPVPVFKELGTPAPWRFVILACGSCILEEEGERPKLRTPSLHLVGAKDQILARSLRLREMFEISDLYEMPYAGHCVPIACIEDLELKAALKIFFGTLRG